MTIHQQRALPIDPGEPAGAFFWFRGGATLIIDPREGHRQVRYCIIKNSGSDSRLDRQRRTASGSFLPHLHALYFTGAQAEPFALLHADSGGSDDE